MSRKARLPINLPKGVEVKLEGNTVIVKGPKGTLQQSVKEVAVKIEGEKVSLTLAPNCRANNFLGLYFTLVDNMVKGVSQGFKKELEMVGVGYRAAVQGKMLDLQIGTSHPMQLPIPEGIQVVVDKNTLLTISGIDKQLVGQYAATVRSKKPPEPYKGKGIRYLKESVRKKAGKAGKATAK